jgi:7-carboxy-7-deazaguanine synthase
MSKGLRLSELYPSIQGEGPRVGQPTVFTRFSGCNMRCPGWPCDTPHAIFPDQWKDDPIFEVADLLYQVRLLPGNNVCITGGEPTMQPATMLADFVSGLLDSNYTIDMFTNGSLVNFPDWIENSNVCVILDWKLRGSGEQQRGVDMRLKNAQRLGSKDAVKFVVADDFDFKEAVELWKAMRDIVCASFFVGAAWGHYPEAKLVEKVLEEDLPWRLNVQVHKYLWPGVEKGI